ncbi:MAG: signal peptidase II [Alphaproteobacteria bacterium]
MIRLGLGLAALVAILDQSSKWLILTQVMSPPRVVEITGFFNLVLVGNRGISFGLLSNDSPWAQPVLAVLAFGISIVLLIWLRRAETRFLGAAIGLVLGGAIGNAVDRLVHGAVVDFLDFHAMGYHWPAFNVADSAICVGVFLILLDGLFAGKSKTR